ncbi:Bcr/CflA family multidrug efflux MFS transporter [Serratia ureilytica]
MVQLARHLLDHGRAALIGSLLVALFIKETLPKERRQRFHLRTTLGNFGSLFRHKRVLSYMLASAFSFAGMFSFLSAGPFVYIELNHVSPQHFGYYFALNIVFLFLTTLINSRNVRRFGAVKMFKLGLLVQLAMGLWLLAVSAVGLGFWALVIGVAVYPGCIAMISSNAMAVILDDFPHMAGTASSCRHVALQHRRAGGAVLSMAPGKSAWPMVTSMALCSIVAVLFYVYASRPRDRAA